MQPSWSGFKQPSNLQYRICGAHPSHCGKVPLDLLDSIIAASEHLETICSKLVEGAKQIR